MKKSGFALKPRTETQKHWYMFGQKEKRNTSKNDNTTWRNKPGSTFKRKKTKNISRQSNTIHTKEDIPKQWKKFYLKVGGDHTKIYQQLNAKEAKHFWSKLWQPRDITKKPNK